MGILGGFLTRDFLSFQFGNCLRRLEVISREFFVPSKNQMVVVSPRPFFEDLRFV